jgi:hypothetical protein
MKNLFKTLKVVLLLTSAALFTNCSNESIEDIKSPENVATADHSFAGRATTTYTIKRYVFNRAAGANGLGHVGVGFEIRTANPTGVFYYYGGVENNNASAYILPGNLNYGWYRLTSTGADMFSVMKNTYGYNRYKFEQTFKNLSLNQVNNSIYEIKRFPLRGYLLAANNCMNATYDVLYQGGGLWVPAPSTNPGYYAPNIWYASLLTSQGWSNNVNL